MSLIAPHLVATRSAQRGADPLSPPSGATGPAGRRLPPEVAAAGPARQLDLNPAGPTS